MTKQNELDGVVDTQTKWDIRFLEMACLVSRWSKDPSTKAGAVIVRPDRTVVSVGFNGFPKSMPDNDAFYQDRDEKYSRIVHCEMNALLHATERIIGYTLYTYPFMSCDRCFVHMAQAGIIRAVAPRCPEDKRERWEPVFEKTRQYAEEMGIELIEY